MPAVCRRSASSRFRSFRPAARLGAALHRRLRPPRRTPQCRPRSRFRPAGPAPDRRRAAAAPAPDSPARQHQRADPLRAANLVRRQRHQIGTQIVDIESEFFQTPGSRRHAAARPPDARVRRPAAIGCSAPVSLLASITETSAGGAFGEHARSWSRSTTPSRVTPMRSMRSAANRPPASTEACSIAETTADQPACRPSRAARRQRQRIGLGPTGGEIRRSAARRRPPPRSLARASSTSRRAARPSAWTDDGLPPRSIAAAIAAAPPAAAAWSHSSRDRPARQSRPSFTCKSGLKPPNARPKRNISCCKAHATMRADRGKRKPGCSRCLHLAPRSMLERGLPFTPPRAPCDGA